MVSAKRLGLRGGRTPAMVCLALCLCVVVASACGGEGNPLDVVHITDDADVGKSLQADGWVVTLIEKPQQRKQVGSEEGTLPGLDQSGHYAAAGFSSMPEAEGMWLILGIELANDTGDLAMLSKRLLTVTDAQGSVYDMQPLPIHYPHIYDDERWMKQENQLMQVVMDADNVREGPLIYDVPEEATGLTLVMKGTDETIDLGF